MEESADATATAGAHCDRTVSPSGYALGGYLCRVCRDSSFGPVTLCRCHEGGASLGTLEGYVGRHLEEERFERGRVRS